MGRASICFSCTTWRSRTIASFYCLDSAIAIVCIRDIIGVDHEVVPIGAASAHVRTTPRREIYTSVVADKRHRSI